jgi:beta-phosphoglucomutase
LDGTLVKTDDIYLSVWKQILSGYNIDLTLEIFNKYIHGNSDASVVNALIPNATTDGIKCISELKDDLFIQNLNQLIIIDGMIDFIKLIKTNGHPCCIVTNSNRLVAEKIVEHCNLSKLIDTIIIGTECARSKPYPDPYLKAIKYYNSSPQKAIIFEDSKSGLLSATQTTPFCVVGITTNYSEKELIKNGANIVINNYCDLNLTQILSHDNLSIEHIKRHVMNSINSFNINIREIKMEETKLKGGYISDVLALRIITKDGSALDCVLKLENTHETKLSIMAKKLGLYERENYFYENVSKYVNILVPKFYGLIKDDNFNTIGILMENLNSNGNYGLNVNLNSNNIDISLQVIANLAKFHNKFWNKDITKIFPELKKHNDKLFNPSWKQFVVENWDTFKENWKNLLSVKQLALAENIVKTFDAIQERLSVSNLTIIHGDVKSPNIFYNLNNNYEPVFLDWQYIAIGKGAQDVIFFLIESFDLENIKLNYPIFKNYYYKKLIECGVQNYSYLEYEKDLKDAVCYFPFFVAIWFGTTPQDDLIDKNFPFFFIQKLFYFLDELQ